MQLYNTLSKEKTPFIPREEGKVGMYHCGPTVYDYVHIGNLRTFLMGDFLRRSFEFLGYEVHQVMNITDIGHLVSDGDDGDDKMTKALKREGKEITLENMLEVADFYAQAFEANLNELHILIPHQLPRASRHIQESIEVVSALEERGHTYTTSDGVYFDTTTMSDYGKLGGLNLNIETSENRIEGNTEKRNPQDFALWKFDAANGWPSPWGQGFPGWHIECSGMSIKYLGPQFDIHTGGSDLASIHHNNEIAQSECSTGQSPFVRYWVHGEMLIFKGSKLSKSTGGNITLASLKEQGFEPLAYRYLTLQTHYRSPMNFSFDVLESAQLGLNKIRGVISRLKHEVTELGSPDQETIDRFKQKISDDLNLPQALAVFHELLKSNLSSEVKLATIYSLDLVLGFDFQNDQENEVEVPEEVQKLFEERLLARQEKNWQRSDELREVIQQHGYTVLDNNEGSTLKPNES